MRREAVGLLIGLLVVSAGCVGSESNPAGSSGPAPSGVVEPEPGIVLRPDLGAIRGTVLSDQGAGLAGARVSVLDTDFFADTDKTGGFLFVNVSAGPKELFVQASGFEPYQVTVEVVAGNVTTHVAQMIPSVTAGAGYRPHQHDFWQGRTQVDIMDDDVDLTKPHGNRGTTYSGAYAMVYRPNSNGSDDGVFRFGIPKRGEDVGMVYPGTKEVRVKFVWTSQQVTLDRLGLVYVHANSTSRVYLPLQASGQEWRIPTTPDMWDTGHQEFTLWQFYVYTGNGLLQTPTTWKPGLVLGTIHVKMTVVKGDLTFEPPHVDFWRGKSELVVRNRSVVNTVTQALAQLGDPMDQYHMLALSQGVLVPPGTKRLKVEFWWEYGPTQGVNTNDAPAYFDYVLTWRTGAQDPGSTEFPEFKRKAPTSTGKGHKVYEIELAPGETDAFYQKKSVWRWKPSPAGFEDRYDYVDTRTRLFRIEVTTYKDPTFDSSV